MTGDSDRPAKRERGIDLGVDALGTAATAGLSSLDPVLGMTGGPVARTILRAAGDVLGRVLSERQRDRTMSVLETAGERVAQRMEAGEEVRDDGFFAREDGDHRADGEEVLEALLIAAGSTAQERKLRHVAAFYASLAFKPEIGADYAALLLAQAQQLTYRQLVLLAVLSGERRDKLRVALDASGTGGRFLFGDEVALELDDLQTRRLAGMGQPGGRVAAATTPFGGGGSFAAVAIDDGTLTRHGRVLHELMELGDIAVDEQAVALSGRWSGAHASRSY